MPAPRNPTQSHVAKPNGHQSCHVEERSQVAAVLLPHSAPAPGISTARPSIENAPNSLFRPHQRLPVGAFPIEVCLFSSKWQAQ